MKNALTLAFIFAIVFSYAQQSPEQKKETERLTQLASSLAGTYQIQVINSREMPAFPLTALDKVAAERKQSENTFFWLKQHIRILVLPYSEIQKKDFKPIDRIVYLSSSEK